jgi:nucleoside-diphosphate-sugar epimerase
MSTFAIVGAGATGTATAQLLVDQGHEVRVLTRSGSGLEHHLVQHVAADAGDASAVTALAQGCVALFNCANPRYHPVGRRLAPHCPSPPRGGHRDRCHPGHSFQSLRLRSGRSPR